MNCRRAQHLLFDFVDGMSNESLRAELDRHVAACQECETFAAEMARALALLRRTPVEPLDENFNWKVRLAIHRERNAVRSRSASVGAWARAWNMRYALSTGLAFGVVLIAGAVVLERSGEPASPVSTAVRDTPADDTRAEAPVRTLVPRPSSTPWQSSNGRLVSMGTAGSEGASTAPGAIDQSRAEAQIDSLIAEDLMRMTPAERSRYIVRRIDRLQSHLQSQQNAPGQR